MEELVLSDHCDSYFHLFMNLLRLPLTAMSLLPMQISHIFVLSFPACSRLGLTYYIAALTVFISSESHLAVEAIKFVAQYRLRGSNAP